MPVTLDFSVYSLVYLPRLAFASILLQIEKCIIIREKKKQTGKTSYPLTNRSKNTKCRTYNVGKTKEKKKKNKQTNIKSDIEFTRLKLRLYFVCALGEPTELQFPRYMCINKNNVGKKN